MPNQESFAEASARTNLAIAAQERFVSWSKKGEVGGAITTLAGVIIENTPTIMAGALATGVSIGLHIAARLDIQDLRNGTVGTSNQSTVHPGRN